MIFSGLYSLSELGRIYVSFARSSANLTANVVIQTRHAVRRMGLDFECILVSQFEKEKLYWGIVSLSSRFVLESPSRRPSYWSDALHDLK